MTTENKTETRSLEVKLTKSEVDAKSSRMAHAHEDKRRIEADAKASAEEFKGRVKGLEIEMGDLARAVRTGAENRDVVCRWQRNDANGTMELFREDTFDRVDVRPMRHDEKQTTLFPIAGGKYEPPPDESEPADSDTFPAAPAWEPAPEGQKARRGRKAQAAP